MNNPITGHYKHLIYYSIFWTAIGVVHFFILRIPFGLSSNLAVSDAAIFTSLFALLGLGLWYVIKYSTWEEKNIWRVFVNLLSSGLLIIGIWYSLASFILQEIHSQNNDYVQFIRQGAALRMGIGFFYFALMVLLYYLILYYSELQENRLRESELNRSFTEARLNTLRAQINPHFLFNSLNSIASLSIDRGEEARDMINRLSSFLRFSLGKAPEAEISLKEELELANAYMAIEKVRFGEKLAFTSHISEDLENAAVPNLILQPLLENAIKYGVQESTEKVNIQLNASKQGESLCITIKNDIDADFRPKKGVGYGQKHVQERLLLLYKQEAQLSFEAKDNCYIANLNLPYHAYTDRR